MEKGCAGDLGLKVEQLAEECRDFSRATNRWEEFCIGDLGLKVEQLAGDCRDSSIPKYRDDK